MSAPITSKERLLILDVLRGISICFIFIANIEILSMFYMMPQFEMKSLLTATADRGFHYLSILLVDGKFYSIFSILFGVGFAMQYNKSIVSGSAFTPFFIRRMLGLLLIGLVHLFFLWYGDILALYAVAGVVLIVFRKLSNRNLIAISILLLVISTFSGFFVKHSEFSIAKALSTMFEENWVGSDLPCRVMGDGVPDVYRAHLTSGFKEHFKLESIMVLDRFAGILRTGRHFKVIALFILGFVAGKKVIDGSVFANKALFRKLMYTGFAIGLPFNVVYLLSKMEFFSDQYTLMIKSVSYTLGVLPLSMAYVSVVVLIWDNKFFNTLFKNIAFVGQTALSNYLLQSLLGILIFRSFGLCMAGKFGLSISYLIAIIIFACQVVISKAWLKIYRYGPIEWIWRQLTYGKRIPLKR